MEKWSKWSSGAFEGRHGIVAVHFGDEAEADSLGTNRFARAGDAAVSKAFGIHLGDDVEDAASFLRLALGQKIQMGDFGGDKQHGGGVLADRDTRAAADACSGVHGQL